MNEIVLKTGISGISGLGLFTESFIPVNAIILHAFTITTAGWSNEIEPTNWLNHSPKNNLSFLKNRNKILYFANRDISPGEELTINYTWYLKYNFPFVPFQNEKDKMFFQTPYDNNRKNKEAMYCRPKGTKYFITYDMKI